MTLALWCVLIAGLMPVLFAAAAKAGGRFTPANNRNPRDFLGTLEGWPQRANWAQQNSFEAFPLFAAAVLIAHMVQGPNAGADGLALGFIGLRLIYGLCYILDWSALRSLVWFGGIACVIGLFVISA